MNLDFKQIRPIIPESGPLLWELAGDEKIQPPLQIIHGFTPGWFKESIDWTTENSGTVTLSTDTRLLLK